jgi:hypothetical protein
MSLTQVAQLRALFNFKRRAAAMVHTDATVQTAATVYNINQLQELLVRPTIHTTKVCKSANNLPYNGTIII